jgi:trans-aconitate methyltransferase
MTLPRSYFDALYAENPDPWGFGSRWYEARKYALTLAVLPLARYRRAFEPGCSIGVLTRSLAGRCDAVVGMDASADALEAAADRVPPNVELVQGVVPQDWPEGTFDLVVLSEVAYYLDDADLDRLVERVTASLEPRGHLTPSTGGRSSPTIRVTARRCMHALSRISLRSPTTRTSSFSST